MINEGLPRGVFVVIGDKSSRSLSSRLTISWTLLYVQTILGLMLSIIFTGGAASFASTFVPEEIRHASLTYVRISAWSTIFSAISIAVSYATRALDRPDVPSFISLVTTTVNIVLDLIFISKFRPVHLHPTVNT